MPYEAATSAGKRSRLPIPSWAAIHVQKSSTRIIPDTTMPQAKRRLLERSERDAFDMEIDGLGSDVETVSCRTSVMAD